MRYIIWFCPSRKGGRFRPPRGHGPRSSLSAGIGSPVCRARANWRFRPQSLPARRAPHARPYLTPGHKRMGYVNSRTGTWRGKDQGLTLGKPRSCPTVLVSQTLHSFPPVSGRALWARRKDASLCRGGAGRSAPTPSSPGPPPGQRANAQSGTIASPSNPLCPSSSSQSRWVA